MSGVRHVGLYTEGGDLVEMYEIPVLGEPRFVYMDGRSYLGDDKIPDTHTVQLGLVVIVGRGFERKNFTVYLDDVPNDKAVMLMSIEDADLMLAMDAVPVTKKGQLVW